MSNFTTMDPKKQQTLDPKLKEVYDRVMGTATKSAAPSVPEPVKAEPTKETPPPAAPQSVRPTVPAPPAPEPAKAHVTTAAPVITSGFVAKGSEEKEKKSGISPVILFLAAVVFLLVYALVWVKFFNIQLPFLTF